MEFVLLALTVFLIVKCVLIPRRQRCAPPSVNPSEELRELPLEAQVLHASPDIHAILHEGRVVYISPRVKDVLGHTSSDMVGERLMDFIDEEPIGVMTREVLKVKNDEDAVSITHRHKHARTGEPIWVTWTTCEVDQGRQFWVGRDVTRLMKARKNISELDASLRAAIRDRDLNEALFRKVFENAPVMINAWDAEGNCIMWNPACGRTLGYTWEEIKVIDNVHEIFYPTPEAQRASAQFIAEAGGYFRTFNVTIRTGEVRHQLWANFKASEDIVIGVGVDITQDQNDRELLEVTVQELRQVNAELEQFAYVASHDLQEPLRKVLSMNSRARRFWGSFLEAMELGKEETAREKLDQVRASLDKSDEHAHRMRVLIHDLLQLSRSFRASPGAEVVDVRERLQLSLDTMAETVHDLRAKVIIPEAPLPKVWVCPADLDRILTNLLSNSLKFRRDAVTPEIIVQVERLEGGDLVQISVSDNGIGFPPEKAGEILQAFKRLHSRSRYEGTGLGLAITRSLVQRSGGSLRAEGRPGKGATFTFTLPQKDTEVALE